MPFPLTETLAKKIPHALQKVFPDAAHLLFLEQAEGVNQAIIDFLSAR